MYTIRNAAPRAILKGIRDLSGRPPVYEPELIPTHLPHLYIFSERGPTLPQFVSGDKMIRMYGADTFRPRSKFFNHQTMAVNTIGAEGNAMMVQRVLPPDANPPSSLRLCVDVVDEELDVYERAIDGSYVLDQEGNKIPTGDKVQGLLMRWFVVPTIESFGDLQMNPADGERLTEEEQQRLIEDGIERVLQSAIGDGAVMTGEMTNTAGEQSQVYPIMDFEVNGIGSFGNRLGVRLSAPTTDSPIPIDDDIVNDQQAYLYRIQLVERDADMSTPRVLESIWGEQFLDFSFKEGVYNRFTNQELFVDDRIIPSFSQEAVAGLPEIQPPFGRIHVYHDYLNEVLERIQTKEAPFGYVSGEPEDVHTVNFFTATTPQNVPYEAVRVMGPSEDGILLSESSTHYAMGGSDGTMNFDTFDLVVRNELRNYGDMEAKLLDSAMYPQSVLYDTGFTMETKKEFFVPMGRRKDLYVVLSTQDVSRRQNRPSEESSIAVALRTAARMYPESVIYGTPTCRALVVGHSGYLLDNPYRGLLPLTIEFAQKCARYMGAGIGSWTPGRAFDTPPNNHVRMFKSVNADWKTANARGRDWDNGLVWVQNYDRRSLFFPGVQTVYDDDSSVLNAAANMFVAVELQKVAERTWRDLTGISYLTPEEFIQRSNRLIRQRTQARFDGRVIIEPETFYTQNDEQRGYSWSCNIHMYAPNMKTVGSFTVVAHRIEDA